MEGDFVKSWQKLIGNGEEVNLDKKLVDVKWEQSLTVTR